MLPDRRLLLSALYKPNADFVAQQDKNYRLTGRVTFCQTSRPFFAGLLQSRP